MEVEVVWDGQNAMPSMPTENAKMDVGADIEHILTEGSSSVKGSQRQRRTGTQPSADLSREMEQACCFPLKFPRFRLARGCHFSETTEIGMVPGRGRMQARHGAATGSG